MKIHCQLEKFRVPPQTKVKLAKWPTHVAPLYDSKKQYRTLLEEYRSEISDAQSRLYADGRYALLLIFQGMDAAGKDGAIKHVMSGVNPQGCQVFSFKQPSAEELAHDFLWRTTCRLPERGRIGVFNRSYYEEVLVVRVNPQLLAAQRLPAECVGKHIWRDRQRAIVHLEDHLHRNGTRVLKFFLHLSNGEQRRRFLERIDDPQKNWKFGSADFAVRQQWDEFQSAYADCLSATSSKHAPWYVVPADDKWNARLIISQAILNTLQDLPLRYPEPTAEQRQALAEAGAKLRKLS